MTLPETPHWRKNRGMGPNLKAVLEDQDLKDFEQNSYFTPATSTDPSRLRNFEKAIRTAKPMGSK